MEYVALVDVYDRLAATDSNNEKRDILAAAFAEAGEMLPRLVTLVRGDCRRRTTGPTWASPRA